MARRGRSEADLTDPPPTADEVYLTSEELAIRYTMHVDSIHRWRSTGKGPRHTVIGGAVRYALSDVLAYEAENRSK